MSCLFFFVVFMLGVVSVFGRRIFIVVRPNLTRRLRTLFVWNLSPLLNSLTLNRYHIARTDSTQLNTLNSTGVGRWDHSKTELDLTRQKDASLLSVVTFWACSDATSSLCKFHLYDQHNLKQNMKQLFENNV